VIRSIVVEHHFLIPMATLVGDINMVDGCPAFKEGCPFTSDCLKSIPDIVKTMPVGVMDKCAAFKEGCPFKGSDSVETLYNKLSEMPSTHRLGLETEAAKAVEQIFVMVHEQSKNLKNKLSAQCPVFATSCPFKTITSDGAPLVQEMDKIVMEWGLAEMAETQTPVSGEPLSKALKSGTKTVHRAAENVQFVRDFLSGTVPKESYVCLLQDLYMVYAALENGLQCLPSHLQHSDFSAIFRAETLKADLVYYTGKSNPLDFEPSASAARYAEHLERLAKDRPMMLLAHAYTRYLGDLSGGQILARAASKAYGLPAGGRGQAFYHFENVGSGALDVKNYKKGYRMALDGLQLSAPQADEMVCEAECAFIMNMLLFEERDVVAGHLPKVHTVEEAIALVKANTSALGFQRAYAGKGQKARGTCPFMPASAQGADVVKGGAIAVCPWPFVWFHDPRAAMTAHPTKNACGVMGVVGLTSLAWHYPRSVAGSLVGFGLVSMALKPRLKH